MIDEYMTSYVSKQFVRFACCMLMGTFTLISLVCLGRIELDDEISIRIRILPLFAFGLLYF